MRYGRGIWWGVDCLVTFGQWEGERIWNVRSLPLCLSFPYDPRGALPVLVGPHLGRAVCGYSWSCTVAVCLFFSSFLGFFFPLKIPARPTAAGSTSFSLS